MITKAVIGEHYILDTRDHYYLLRCLSQQEEFNGQKYAHFRILKVIRGNLLAGNAHSLYIDNMYPASDPNDVLKGLL